MAKEDEQEQGGGNGGNQNPSGVGVIINFLNAGNMRLGDINAMGGNQGSGGNQQTVNLNRVTTIDDPEYEPAKTRVYYTDGTYEDFEWYGQVTQDTTINAGLYDDDKWEWVKDIEEVHFGTAVTVVNESAFSMSSTISNVTFEENYQATISGGAFSECPNLADSSGFAVIDMRLVSIDPSKLGENVTVPTTTYGIEYIEPFCFVNLDYPGRIVSVTIPTVVNIRPGAFDSCNYIQELHLPSMAIADLGNDYETWNLGEEYSQQSPDPIYRAITIYCSDGTIVQDTTGSWTAYPND